VWRVRIFKLCHQELLGVINQVNRLMSANVVDQRPQLRVQQCQAKSTMQGKRHDSDAKF